LDFSSGDEEETKITRIKAEPKCHPPPISMTNSKAASALIDMFDCDDSNNLGPRWTQWHKRLEQLFTSNGTDDDAKKNATLFLLGGPRLFEIHETLPIVLVPPAIEGDGEYDKAVKRLNTYFNPKRNRVIEEFKFCQAKQDVNETIEQYATRLRVLAKYCEFHDQDREMVKQIIQTCNSDKLRRELLRSTELTIAATLDKGRAHDTVEGHARLVEGKVESEAVEAINQYPKTECYGTSYSNYTSINQ